MYETVLCYIENNKNEYLMLYRNKKEKDILNNTNSGISFPNNDNKKGKNKGKSIFLILSRK